MEETRMGLMTQIDLLQELKVQLEFNRAAGQIGELLKRGEASLNSMQVIAANAQQLANDLAGFGTTPAAAAPSTDGTNPRAGNKTQISEPVGVRCDSPSGDPLLRGVGRRRGCTFRPLLVAGSSHSWDHYSFAYLPSLGHRVKKAGGSIPVFRLARCRYCGDLDYDAVYPARGAP